MPFPSPFSNLEDIRIKVRRLTRSPSPAQLTDQDIDNYVNTFILYDMPEHLRLFDLRTVFTFYCQPNIDTYATNTTNPNDPFYNFVNNYTSIHPPVFIAGYDSFWTQSREQMFNIYPNIANIAQVAAGDGTTTFFSGTLQSTPVLQNEVIFSSVDINNNGLILVDQPTSASVGQLFIPNNESVFYGTVNYITGAFSFTFPTAPGDGIAINSQTVPYTPARPLALLYYDDVITLRPVPDQPYQITVEAYVLPTQLINDADQPNLLQWAQYICYGAARKVLQDRMDLETLQLIEPEYKKQELLTLRKTIVQYTNERTATIYTENVSGVTGSNGWGSGGGNF